MKYTGSKKLILFALLLLSTMVFAQNHKIVPSGKERVQSTRPDFEKEVIRLVNIEREKVGAAPVKMGTMLTYAARYHAKDMAINDYFMHETFYLVSSGELEYFCEASTRRKLFTGSAYGGENILTGYNCNDTPKKAVEAWMGSNGHRKNILNHQWKYLGVGYYSIGKRHYWVQDFQ